MMFEDYNYSIDTYTNIDQGLMAIENTFYDVVLLDMNFDGDNRTGLDIFRRISAKDSEVDVIVISGETNTHKLIEVMNAGITQFIPKPASIEQIRSAVDQAIKKKELRRHSIILNQAKGAMIVGSSKAMVELKAEIAKAAQSGVKDILITGESGTGKEVVARAIAELADAAKRFIPIHCAAINDGVAESELFGHVKGAFTSADKDRVGAFEAAQGGFVFLDEIGDMPLNQQAKLLRVLQERKVQRVGTTEEKSVSFKSICATHVNLAQAVQDKRFREDLIYRIAKFKIEIPPLRRRIEDIPELIVHFLATKFQNKVTITPQAVGLMQSYYWPGNVRQLEATIETMAYRCENKIIREKDVCKAIPELSNLVTSKQTVSFLGKQGAALVTQERKRFEKAIIDARGDRTKAAEMLKVSRATFFRRAKELGLVTGRRV
jgi:DNA-binding NtrC family response regulator